MDTYMHLNATFWRSEDGRRWSCTLHPYYGDGTEGKDVRFHGTDDVTFHDAHNMSGTLRACWTNMLITYAGVQLELF